MTNFINFFIYLLVLYNILNIKYSNTENLYCNKNSINYEKSSKWKKNKNMLFKIKNFEVNGNIIFNNEKMKNTLIKFYCNNIKNKYFKFKVYTYGINLIDFVSYPNKKEKIKKNKIIKSLYVENFPIKNLKLWLIGLPSNSDKFVYNKNGYLKEIKHNIYNIIYHEYYDNLEPKLPINIEFIEKNSNNNFYLKICNWNFY
ncbi:outer-membrane lipoprotein LolB [endosymbiont of Sipalinus gigas]|uniref:lipoprotein insertase outer membrane protein LolB n=1 Tax=endosymbiont of Sipalinus gigas TaxID=1972134 RepID=UPI000DC7111F|nr:lipoprotein insertase outer membrane protein LolB [endosymbiont of Sipalinus gigas]BBA85207.1 outer-membrane lipoprotein LolB [endosymbiont of Sipalinus gigas]